MDEDDLRACAECRTLGHEPRTLDSEGRCVACQPIDHPARAARLRTFMEEWSKVNDDSLDEANVALDDYDPEGERPDASRVPYRYVANTWNGSASWLVFTDSLDYMRDALASGVGEDYPNGPGDVVDLDTGARWTPLVEVKLQAYTHRVTYEYRSGFTSAPWLRVTGNFIGEGAANAYVEQVRTNGLEIRGLEVQPLVRGEDAPADGTATFTATIVVDVGEGESPADAFAAYVADHNVVTAFDRVDP